MRIKRNETRRFRSTAIIFVLLMAVFVTAASAQNYLPVYALTNATVITGTGKTIENTTVLIRDGLIMNIGDEIGVPAEAEVIDCTGLNVYAGFVDLHTNLGFKAAPQNQRRGPQQGQPQQASTETPPNKRGYDPNLRPDKVAIDEVDLNDKKFASARKAGVTSVLTLPRRGVFPGKASFIFTMGDDPVDAMIINPGIQFIQSARERGGYPATIMGYFPFREQSIIDAKYYFDLEERFKKNPRGMKRPVYDPVLRHLFPAVGGEERIVIIANKENEIKDAVKFCTEYDLDYVISGAIEGYRIIDLLKNAKIPLIVSVKYPSARSTTGYAFNMPIKPFKREKREGEKKVETAEDMTKELDKRIKAENQGNPNTLYTEGIDFVLSSGGQPDKFLKNVRDAVKAGLPEDVALAKMTIEPAEMIGMGDFLGTVEEGKAANLVICQGGLFDSKTKINYVFVNGNKVEVEKPKKEEVEAEDKKDEAVKKKVKK
ncbi:MAG: amidohydrolase family protein [bacterium]|nr:amidohydrolase family protein [bacterium]